MYKHMLDKDLLETVKTPFWRRVAAVLTPDVLQIVSEVPNTSQMHYQAYEKFIKHPEVEAFFTKKEIDKRDAKRAQEDEAPEGHYVVELKPTTRDKIDEGVKKAVEFAQRLATHKMKSKKERKRERKADKKYNALLSKQIADKEEATTEHEDVIKFLDNQLEADIEQMETATPASAAARAGDTKPDIKFGNPLADLEFDAMDPTASPQLSPKSSDIVQEAPAVATNEFEDRRKEAKQTKHEKKNKKTDKKKMAKNKAEAAEAAIGSDSDEDDGLEFKGVLPPFLRLVVKQQSNDVGAERDGKKFEQLFVGGYQQGDLFNGCPCYVRSAMLIMQTGLGEMQVPKTVHVSVIRGTSTDRWFLCSDADRLDDTLAHEASLTAPKGQLPLGTFQWRLGDLSEGTAEVTIALEACVSFPKLGS
jgi:hypothetical protein